VFKFVKIPKNDDYDTTEVVFTINNDDITLQYLLLEFECFLKACGYYPDSIQNVKEEKS
jgi:hypothetical protein